MMRRICVLVAVLMAASAAANDTVSVDFEVTADAAACTPTLSNNGVVDFGSRTTGSISTATFSQLGTRDITLSVTCESSTAIAITARDTRAASVVSGEDENGHTGARFQINGGQYVSEPARLFGLGLTAEKKAIGSYAVQINAAGVTATDGDKSVLVDIAGSANQAGPWAKSALLPLPTSQDYFYTFVQKGMLSPQPISTVSLPLQVSVTLANKLNSSQVIKLDGEAVISIVYL
ncbi:DUF1120 domain-containing protein [Leclercia barmai]|uniref:DUF1120 domain-containing protein n=1 Tax=Leclercia barmai TaxID=2785629 RepID=UPI003CF74465